MTPLSVLALDVSLTCTGYASTWTAAASSGVLVPPREASAGIERLAWIREAALTLSEESDLVVLEGYSFGSKGRATVSLGELGGVVRVALWEAGVPVVEVSPSGRAKYATGAGNASKDAVLAAAIRRFGYTGHLHDEADALVLLRMAQDHYALEGRVDVPTNHRAALGAVAWPTPEALSAARRTREVRS